MNNREFEEFILMQIKRSHSIHAAGRWIYLVLAIAGVVTFIVGITMGLGIAGGVPLLIASIGFLPASIISKSAAESYADAAEDMSLCLEDPECVLPDDYDGNTKTMRQNACKTLKSTRGLIISYGIIALGSWVGAVIIVIVSDPWGPFFEPAILALSSVLFAIAVVLTILTIKSIRDLPMARRYARWLKEESETDSDDTE